LTEEQKPAESPLGRSQVVSAIENDFWVLTNGELQRLHFDLFGQKMVPLWANSLPLGSPLHAGQLDENDKTLFVVTQDLKRQAFLATAVDAERGKILWQRQLGLDAQTDPLVVAGQVLVVDRGGGVFAFATKRERLVPGQDMWWKNDPVPVGEALAASPYLFVTDNGTTLYAVAEKGSQLTIRKYVFGGDGEAKWAQDKEETFPLPASLRGAPAIGPQGFLLVLADGTMQRIPLPLEAGTGAGGPDWRSNRADEGAPGYVVQISANEFLTTDGSRGLTHWQWPPGKSFGRIPEDRVPTVDLPARIVASPLVLPQGNELSVVVADAGNRLTLLHGPELKTQRVWTLGGTITGGPFLRGQRIGCIVDKRHLVWIDAAQDKEAWRYTMPGGQIVGEPLMIGDMLVLGNLSGRFVGLDPEKGNPRGGVYTLKAKTPPAATPVAYGLDDAFVALTDGTVFLLPLRQLRQPAAASSMAFP
jgi:outer membrane protein assembly factor BamB